MNILIFGVILYISWAYATRAALLKEHISKEVTAAICRRIIYRAILLRVRRSTFFFSTYLSIGMIISVQLFYVFSPWLPKPTEQPV